MSRGELLSAGWSADDVRLGVQFGSLYRLCRGWYGSSDLPAAVRAAWSHGGPLACVSALEFLDMVEGIADPTAPHVCRPSRGHRLRHAGSATIHWSDEAYASGTRWVVALETALAQAAQCAPRRLPEHERAQRLPPLWPGTIDPDEQA